MARYSDILTDQNLRPIKDALVSVLASDGSYATLTYDNGDPLDNPFYTPDTGAYYFNATDAVYTIQFRYGGRLVEENNVIVGSPPDFVGATGPAFATFFTLANFKAAPITNATQVLQAPGIAFGQFNWETANAPYTADDINIIKADSTALTVGAWVRQKADGITFLGPFANEVPRSVETLLQEGVDIRRFGAICDGVTDDSTAFDRAVAECIRETYAKPLIIPGPVKLTGTRMVNRPVDQSLNRFRVIGRGHNAGFIGGGFTMFDSTAPLGGGVDPSSEFVTLEGVRFIGDGTAASRIFSEKFFRMQVLNCEMEGIRCMVATSAYAQEWQFENVWVRGANGNWFDCQGAFAVRSIGGKYRNNSSVIFDLRHDSGSKGVVSCGFIGDTYESNGGSFLQANSCVGLEVSNLYSEGSQGPVLDFSGAFNRSIIVASCEFESTSTNNADANYYAVKWGPGGGASVGNSAVCNMHDNDLSGYDGVKSIGDGVTAGKKKFRNDQEKQFALLPDPAGGYGTKVYASAVGVNPSNAVAAHTIALPPPYPGMKPIVMSNVRTTLSYDYSVLPSYSADGSSFRGQAANAGLVIKAGQHVMFSCADAGIYDVFFNYGAMPTVANPTGGATVDAEARTQLAAVITALRNSGRMS